MEDPSLQIEPRLPTSLDKDVWSWVMSPAVEEVISQDSAMHQANVHGDQITQAVFSARGKADSQIPSNGENSGSPSQYVEDVVSELFAPNSEQKRIGKVDMLAGSTDLAVIASDVCAVRTKRNYTS